MLAVDPDAVIKGPSTNADLLPPRARPMRRPAASRGCRQPRCVRDGDGAAPRAAGLAPDQRRQPHQRQQPHHERAQERPQPRLHGRRREGRGLPRRDGPGPARLPAQRPLGRHRLPGLHGRGQGQTGGGEAFGDVSSLVSQGKTTYNLDQEINPDFATTGGTCDVKVLGVAPGADVDVMKVFGASNVSFTSEILQGVDWAIQNDHADILSMSFGSTPAAEHRGRAAADGDPQERDVRRHRRRRQHRRLQPVEHRGEPGARPRRDRRGGEHLVPALRPDQRLPVRPGPGDPQRQRHAVVPPRAEHPRLARQRGLDALQLGRDRGPADAGRHRPRRSELGRLLDRHLDLHRLRELARRQHDRPRGLRRDERVDPAHVRSRGARHPGVPSVARRQKPTPAVVRRIIFSSATDIGITAENQGSGLLNALRAVQLAKAYGKHAKGGGLLHSPDNLADLGKPGASFRHTIKVTNTGGSKAKITPVLRTLGKAHNLAGGKLNLFMSGKGTQGSCAGSHHRQVLHRRDDSRAELQDVQGAERRGPARLADRLGTRSRIAPAARPASPRPARS